jgi:hypothetical protein
MRFFVVLAARAAEEEENFLNVMAHNGYTGCVASLAGEAGRLG